MTAARGASNGRSNRVRAYSLQPFQLRPMSDFCKRDILYRLRDELRVAPVGSHQAELLRDANNEIELLQTIIMTRIKSEYQSKPETPK